MKKCKFKIAMKDGSTKMMDGYLDEITDISLSKHETGGWIAHDHRTGYHICAGMTRQEAIDRALERYQIFDIRCTPSYKKLQTINP